MQACNATALPFAIKADASNPAKVFITEDDPATLAVFSQIVSRSGFELTILGSIEDLLSQPVPTAPSCLVLSVAGMRVDALTLQELMVDRPETPIVFVASHPDARLAMRAAKIGGVITKPLQIESVVDAIRSAFARSRAFLARLSAMQTVRVRHATLTRRERQVLKLVVAGRLNKQIAAELGISEITVKAHRGKMMRKMRANSVPALVGMSAHLQLDIPGFEVPIPAPGWPATDPSLYIPWPVPVAAERRYADTNV